MQTYAIIENGTVINIATAAGTWPFPNQTAIDITNQSVGIGWTWDGSSFTAPPVPPPVSRRVLKLTIRHRLRAVGLEATADAARATLPAADQQDWNDAWFIYSDDSRMISFLTTIGADPSVVLAMDPDAP
jgi:hypothetical protein